PGVKPAGGQGQVREEGFGLPSLEDARLAVGPAAGEPAEELEVERAHGVGCRSILRFALRLSRCVITVLSRRRGELVPRSSAVGTPEHSPAVTGSVNRDSGRHAGVPEPTRTGGIGGPIMRELVVALAVSMGLLLGQPGIASALPTVTAGSATVNVGD